MWVYTEALGSPRQIVEKAGDDPVEVALHSLCIGAATTTLAAEGELPQEVIQREGHGSRQSHPRGAPGTTRRAGMYLS